MTSDVAVACGAAAKWARLATAIVTANFVLILACVGCLWEVRGYQKWWHKNFVKS